MSASTSAWNDRLNELEKQIAEAGIEFVRFEQTDTHGISRSKTIPVRHFRHFAEGGLNFLLGQLGFDVQAGVAPGTGYLEELGFPDSRIKPDLDTFKILPWADKTARILCEPYFLDDRPALAAPRLVVKKLLEEVEALGYRLYSGFEYEFYLVDAATRQPPFPGIQIFATLRNNFNEALVYQILPWADKTARILCEPYFLDDRPALAAPRLVVKKLLEEVEALGYRLYSGFEYEFYLVDAATRQPPFPGIQIFATLRNNFNEALVYQILRSMAAVGVDIITANAEYGPGQMEINFAPAWGVSAADNAFTFKNGLKEIVQRNGMMASFMTKPHIDQSANGCHYHQSLWQNNKNVFLDTSSPDGLSQVAHQYLAGQIAHAAAICAFAAPTVNCPKRYKLYSFAPTNATWGFENRTVGIRVKATGDERTHIENRLGGGASNPYLFMAACVAAGLDGLKNKLASPAPVDGIAYGLDNVTNLPARLEDALAALEQDAVMKEALGAELVKLFVAVKRHEINKAKTAIQNYDTSEFNDRVDEWERNEYFEFL